MELFFAITLVVLAWSTSVLTFGFGLGAELFASSLNRDIQHMVTTVGGLSSALLWFLSAFGASSLEVTDSGVTVVNASAAATYLFAGFGIFMVVIAFIGTGVLLNVTDVASGTSRPRP